MKKVILFSIFTLALFSCKKVHQCECKQIVNGEDWNPIVTNVAIDDTKSNAETTCKSLEYSLGWQDYKNCELK